MDNSLNASEQETVYAAAYGFYETGAYSKAAEFFTHLIFHNPFEKRFWKGLASARQMSGDYQAALHAWAILCFLAPDDPLPHFHSAECLISMGEQNEAIQALHCAEKRASVDQQERIQFLKTRVSNAS